MRRYWFVTNARSGSTAETVAADIRDTLSAMGHDVAGRTGLPNDDLPSPDALARAGVEWMVVYAGDGTVNTVLTALDAWDGAILILPGGTMNLLARTLHGERDALAILRRLADHPPRHVSLPFAEADGHHAYAGLILGPATRWAAAREAVRDGRIGRLLLAVRLAWRRSFGTGLKLAGVPALPRRYQAVFVTPHGDRLDVAAVDARTWRKLFDLGRMALTDDWTRAQGVTVREAPAFASPDAALSRHCSMENSASCRLGAQSPCDKALRTSSRRPEARAGPCLGSHQIVMERLRTRRGSAVPCLSRPLPLCAAASGHGHPWRRGRKPISILFRSYWNERHPYARRRDARSGWQGSLPFAAS